ncbi:MAG: hypothetical protein ACI9WU_003658 [Myxococcota bacterium]|jgi:hypothetical protein
MTARWIALSLVAVLTVAAPPARAEAPETAPGAYVTINVGVELHAIERSANEVSRSLSKLAGSVGKLATSPSLSAEQKTELLAVIARVDTLSDRVATAIDRIPDAVEKSRKPLTSIATELASDVRTTVFVTLGLALLVTLGALAAAYLLILKPSRRLVFDSTQRIVGLFEALERTAKLVEKTNESLQRAQGPATAETPGNTESAA